MSYPLNEQSTESVFGKVISSYTRAQAIEDGVLIDAGPMASEVGFNWPVALTSAVWADCVAWTDGDSQKQAHQDQSGRLWDVVYMASQAIRTSKDSSDRLLFQVYRVPCDGHSTKAECTALKLIIGPGDTGKPVITILLPNED